MEVQYLRLKVWEAICTLFNYSKELRKIMYTTNAIESLNRSYHKYTKTKGVFTSDSSLIIFKLML